MKGLRLDDAISALRKAYKGLPQLNSWESDTIEGVTISWWNPSATGEGKVDVTINCQRTFTTGYATGYRGTENP